MSKCNYKRGRDFISGLQGTAWSWGGCWELIGGGREERGEEATCPSGPRGEGRRRCRLQGERADIPAADGSGAAAPSESRQPNSCRPPPTYHSTHTPHVSVNRTLIGCGKCHF